MAIQQCPSPPTTRYQVYVVELSWGETRYFAARLEDASAPVYYWSRDDEWVSTQWQTANFRHDETRAAIVVLDGDESEDAIDNVSAADK